jgi:serine/threonine protein kinase/Flp pilus assembly protein TadD
MTEPSLPEESIFAQAVEIKSAAERAAFLDRACGENQALRTEVEALLRAHERSGDLLDLPETNAPATTDLLPREGAGTRFGPYKLLEQIGEGGMGNVWMAEQTDPIQRRVAVKVVKEGMDSRQVLARFEVERQALALMEHPNIAKVLDAGRAPSGRPYFVMELVKGKPITHYCDEQRLAVRERLALFGDVCRAVQHAHQKGIIHRDLKPSNVLVAPYDGKPVVKVIDFGVAKATGQRLTDKTLFTGFGALVGTPEYMSPEQAEVNNQDIDTRSDIYTLGVLLYELLTGTTPLTRKRIKEAALLEVLRVIREEEPPRPSTRLMESKDTLPSISAQRQTEPAKLAKLVRGELDWIAMKALEKDRNRRYETANGFAMDVQRYLADLPVQACPPSTLYRLRIFARRNKTALVVAGLILCFITLLGGGAGWVVRDRAARRSQAAQELERTLDRAELFQGQGKRAEALAALQRAELLASQAMAGREPGGRLALLKQRLDAEALDQEFLARFQEIRLRSQSRAQANELRFSPEAAFPEIRDALGRYGIDIAVTPAKQAADRVGGRPEPARQQLLAALDECLSQAPAGDSQARQWLVATLDEADNDPARVRLRQALLDRDWPTLEPLARAMDVRQQPPSLLLVVARSLPVQMKSSRLELFRKIQRANPADLWANHLLADELMNHDRPAEAVRYYTAALALLPGNSGVYNNRARALKYARELTEAIADFRQALALAPDSAKIHHNLAEALGKSKEFEEAVAEYRTYFRQEAGDAESHYNFGVALGNSGRLDESIAEYRKAVSLKHGFALARLALGQALGFKGEVDLASVELREAVRLDPDNAESHFWLGKALWALGRLDEAIVAYREAIRIRKDYAEAHCNLGLVLRQKGEFREALQELRRGHELGSKIPGWPIPSAQWVRECERSVELDQRLPDFLSGKTKPASPEEMVELAELCLRKQRNRAAARFYDEAFSPMSPRSATLIVVYSYNAACAAALAGCGQGTDADKLDEDERRRLRRQALYWLRGNLESMDRLLDRKPDQARDLTTALKHWLADPDFARVRGTEALARLPEAERPAWQKVWRDIADLLKRAQEKVASQQQSGAK